MSQNIDAGLINESGGPVVLRLFAVLGVIGGTLSTVLNLANGIALSGAAQAIVVLSAVTLMLLRSGHIRAAAYVFLWGLLATNAYGSYAGAGLYNATWLIMPLATMVMGWMLGTRAAIFLVIGSVLVVIALIFLHATDHVFRVQSPPAVYGLVVVLLVVVAAAVGSTSASTYRRQLGQVKGLSDRLQQVNNDLEQRVTDRTAELTSTVERLQQTRLELVESEKLAALGALVAGISHELNTPIGNAVTVSTTMRAVLRGVAENTRAGQVRRSDLEELFKRGDEMLELIERSVVRAADLIANFKQVAIDQTSERRREFDLREVVEANLATMRPGFKRQPWEFFNRIPEGIVCDSYPGPLGQIITNLLQNTATHAFEGCNAGRVDIDAVCDANTVTLTVRDDGNGMDGQTLARVFDPFFTTKLGQGGSGLGLAICHRIARSVLGGDLTVTSTPGQGCVFELRLARIAAGGHLAESNNTMNFGQ